MKTTFLALAVFTGCAFFTSTAHAQCSAMKPKSAIAWQAVQAYNPFFASPALVPDASIGKTPQARGGDPSIVGLWRVTFTSAGQVVDQAFEVFHGDGTEMMVDTSAPASDNVCVGIWAQVNGLEFKLNHLSWTFDDLGNLNGTATIKLDVNLDPNSNLFKGTFTVDVFALTGAVVLHLDGTVAGQRVTVD
jgi:hypothetical protein